MVGCFFVGYCRSSKQNFIDKSAVQLKKGRAIARPHKISVVARLLNFAFFIFNMLAYNRIILPDNHFLCHGTCIFLGHVKVARVRTRIQADLDCGWLRHCNSPTGAAYWPH
jgi:hypothetical protein